MKKGGKEGQISQLKRMTGKESSRQENKEANHPKKTNYNKKKQIGIQQIGKRDSRNYTQTHDVVEMTHKNPTPRTSTSEEREQNNNGETTD